MKNRPASRRNAKHLILGWGLPAAFFSILIAVFFTMCPKAGAQVSEYQVKAAYLANFPEFITWPDSAFSGPGAPIVIGVLGTDPFGGVLDRAVQGKGVGGRGISIRRSQRVEDLKSCHIIFISRSEQGQLAAILASLSSSSILTVSDIEQFARQGGMIGFSMSGPNVRFDINNGAAKRVGLSISSRLLKLAR